jgi:hypothetical protein
MNNRKRKKENIKIKGIQLLSIPASLTASKRVFSETRRILQA